MVRETLQQKYDQAEEKTFGRMNRRPPLEDVDAGISDSEEILAVAKCLQYPGRPTTLVLTSLGMHYFSQGMYLRSANASHEFLAFGNITGIRAESDLFGGTATLEVSGANNVDLFTWCSPKDCESIINLSKALMAQVQLSPQAAQENPLDQIKKLKEIFDLGIISEGEYEEKKAKLLGSI